jgi:ribosome-associated heat shock protein Hsp15
VRVARLAERRGSAPIAAQLYSETEESARRREAARLERVPRDPASAIRGRPTKRARRQLQKVRSSP